MKTSLAGVIHFEAKPGEGAEVARLLAAALPHVEQEEGTPLWLILRSNAKPDSVFLVDLFTDVAALEAHLNGDAAKLIFDTVPPHLKSEPVIHSAEIVARKGA